MKLQLTDYARKMLMMHILGDGTDAIFIEGSEAYQRFDRIEYRVHHDITEIVLMHKGNDIGQYTVGKLVPGTTLNLEFDEKDWILGMRLVIKTE